MKLISTSTKNASFSVAFLASLLIHGATTLLIPTLINYSPNSLQQHFIPIALIELPQVAQKEETPSEVKKSLPHIQRKVEKPVSKNEIVPTPRSAPPTAAVEPTSPMGAKTDITSNPENTPSFAPTAPVERGDVGVVPGPGTEGQGSGTAASGLGRGSGAAGLPAPTTVLKTNREAKPTQTARASYPPMALRMGLEGDVTLRIEVDTEGKVTKAEIIKGAGTVFDEEALKAVKQSRFEPAQKDGRNVPAEFTYVYHFRLSK